MCFSDDDDDGFWMDVLGDIFDGANSLRVILILVVILLVVLLIIYA